ncbi:MAG: enoyl-CoA hydratase-related protein [Actinomycetota bacterium]|nr:enoyl-CoA hydratase/isomerase family protein [Actinomycetota bacterium]
MPKVLLERRGNVSILTLNRPEVHNCVDGETAEALATSIKSFASDDAAHVLIVTGAGEKSFCSGADLKHADELLAHSFVDESGPMGFARLDPGKPVIAAVNGYCFAGGLELAAWCDFRIAADNAEFGALNRRWGVPFTDGGTQRFARIAGIGTALYLIETGIRIDAQKALALGFVQEVVPAGTVVDRAFELAERVAGYPQNSMRADREATLKGFGMPLRDALALEAELCLKTVEDPELTAGLARYASGDRPDAPR